MNEEKITQITELLAKADEETIEKVIDLLKGCGEKKEETFDDVKGEYFGL